eukprot:gb/GFBE01083637.1/.p1 GENE.gb/GFBE01083637.1/~~gb/GFBE01083637.1/.p1  ORF type:complete len:1874 (+),score=508.55 gb/GFBE01083637.1/:1-5622(+)
MGCLASKKAEPESVPPEEQTPLEDDEETKQLIKAITERIVGIRTKAKDYCSGLQTQITEIENAKCGSLEEQPVRVSGVVTVTYKPEEGSADIGLLEAEHGQEIEILVRDMGGWTYCRRQGDKTPGWLPADRVAEIAQLIADHDVGEAEGLLSLKYGDTVEVLSRHYSGWAQCRLWHGPQLPGTVDDREIGWVTDAYLQDNRSEAMLASKWHRLVLQALDEVVVYAQQLEGYLAEAKPEDRCADPEWMEKCMQFCLYLGTELQQITDALSQHELSENAAGKYATVSCEVTGNSAHELTVDQDARVLILEADNPDWAWCRAVEQDGTPEGWVPRNLLVVDPGAASADASVDPGSPASQDIPEWVKVGEMARWWSTSQQQYCDVTVSTIDKVGRQVTVTFVQDSNCWKCVPFEHFQQKEEEWLLQPLQQKAKELINQLPSWVGPGRTAYWWSASQSRVLPVSIKDVCSRTRQVKVSFQCNKTVKKLVPFHELIDNPEECLLQKERSGHRWRKPRKNSKGGASSAADEDDVGDAGDVGAMALGDLMTEITQDIGDMMGPESGFSANPNEAHADDLRKALAAMGNSEQTEAGPAIALPDSPTRPGPELPDCPALVTASTGSEVIALPDSPTKKADGVPSGTDVADAIHAVDLTEAQQALAKPGDAPVEKEGSKEHPSGIDYTNSEYDLMENLEKTATFDGLPGEEGKEKEGPTLGGEVMYDTMDKELLAELMPPSPSAPADPTQDKQPMEASAEAVAQEAAESSPGADASPEREPSKGGDAPSSSPADLGGQASKEPTTSSPAEAAEGGVATEPVASATTDPVQAGSEPAATPSADADKPPEMPAAVDATATGAAAADAAGAVVAESHAGGEAEAIAAELTMAAGTPSAEAKNSAQVTSVTASVGQAAEVAEHVAAGEATASAEPMMDTLVSTSSEVLLPATAGAEPGTPTKRAETELPAPSPPGPAEPHAPRVEAWGTGPAPPTGPAPSAEELQKAYLEELEREQAKADAAARAAAQATASNTSLGASKGASQAEGDMDEGLGDTSILGDVSGASVLLREAVRLVVPDTWDSEDEAKTGRRQPDLSRLASCWELLDQDLQTAEEAENTRVDEELEREAQAAMSKIEVQEVDLKDRLEQRAKAAEAKLDPTTAQELRKMAWAVVNAAEGAKEKRQLAKASRVGLARRKVKSHRVAVQKVLGPAPAQIAGPAVLNLQLPSAEALEKVSSFEAIAEVSEAVRSCFRSLQVVALMKPELAGARPPPGCEGAASAWDDGSKAEGADLASVTLSAIPALAQCLQTLSQRINTEKEDVPEVDPQLRIIALDEDKMNKEQKRDKLMFEGQQEYDWERSINLKIQEQTKRRQAYTNESLERVSRVLHRRWRRQRDRDRARTMSQMAAFLKAMEETEAALEAIRREQLEATNKEADELETERRRLQEQTRELLSAALVIRQEKERMNQAWYAEPKEKKKLLLQSLKIIRRVNHDMKNFPVIAEFKQKHSVLLYSLRMLEARLSHDCPGATEADIHEGPMEQTKEQKQQLAEAEATFEEQLSADVDALRARNRAKAERAMAREAAKRRTEAEAEHAPCLQAAAVALRESERSARRAEVGGDILRPLATLTAQLSTEAFRHAQVDKGLSEPGSFGPRRKRLEASLDATAKVLRELAPQLDCEQVERAIKASSKLGKDPEWEAMLEKTEKKWKEFCETYAAHVVEEQETPRGENGSLVTQSSMLNSTLEIDDLDEDDPGTPTSPVSEKGGTGRRGGRGAPTAQAAKKPPPPSRTPAAKQAPARPPSAGGSRPPAKPPVPGGRSAKPTTPAASGGEIKQGAALLAKLDELSAHMDRTLGKNGALNRTSGGGGKLGKSGSNLKPPGPAGRKR